MTARELALAWIGLGLLSAIVFLPHIFDGGFYLDDWSDAAATLHPSGGSGFFSALSYFNDLLHSGRPVLILFIPLKYILFGTNVHLLLGLTVLLAFLASALFYGVLRITGVPWYHAWVISALAVVYPWFDSTRLWESANPITLAIVLALAGLWLALAGLSRDSWRLHAIAAALYLLSMLTYEVTLPLIAMAGLLYTARYGWRMARGRWGVDLVMVAIAGLWGRTHTPKTVSGLSNGTAHLEQIVSQGGEILARTLFPIGNEPHTSIVLLAVFVIFAGGVAVFLLRPDSRLTEVGWGMRRWLILGLSGLLIAALGWAAFIPADPYYTPSIFGATNRVNGVAGFGLLLSVYAVLGIVGALAGYLFARVFGKQPRWLPPAIIVSFAVMLGATYTHVLERHADIWQEAYSRQWNVVRGVHKLVPNPSPGTTLFVSGNPSNVTGGVPIFSTTWDMNGMVKLTYGTPSVRGFPITEEMPLECLRDGVRVGGDINHVKLAPYGRVLLVSLRDHWTATPVNRHTCGTYKRYFEPGELYLASAY
jgi:hypothetical protein